MASQSVIDAGGDCDYGHGGRGVSFEVRSVQAGNRNTCQPTRRMSADPGQKCHVLIRTQEGAQPISLSLIYTTPSTVFRFANPLPSRHSRIRPTSRKNYLRIHFKISVSRQRSTFNGDQHASGMRIGFWIGTTIRMKCLMICESLLFVGHSPFLPFHHTFSL